MFVTKHDYNIINKDCYPWHLLWLNVPPYLLLPNLDYNFYAFFLNAKQFLKHPCHSHNKHIAIDDDISLQQWHFVNCPNGRKFIGKCLNFNKLLLSFKSS